MWDEEEDPEAHELEGLNPLTRGEWYDPDRPISMMSRNWYRNFLYAMREYDEEPVPGTRMVARGSRIPVSVAELLVEGRHPDQIRAAEAVKREKENRNRSAKKRYELAKQKNT